jgi:hypothetical protein
VKTGNKKSIFSGGSSMSIPTFSKEELAIFEAVFGAVDSKDEEEQERIDRVCEKIKNVIEENLE